MITTNNITLPCGVEADYNSLDSTAINSILAEDLFVGVYGYGSETITTKELIDMGVTRFTEDYNASNGLNW